MTNGASGSRAVKRPASASGCVMQTQRRPFGTSTRLISWTTAGMSSTSISEL